MFRIPLRHSADLIAGGGRVLERQRLFLGALRKLAAAGRNVRGGVGNLSCDSVNGVGCLSPVFIQVPDRELAEQAAGKHQNNRPERV